MVEQRLSEMGRQQAKIPSASVSGPLIGRVSLIGERVFQQCATLSFAKSWIINGILCLVGLSFLLFSAWSWLRGGVGSGGSMVLLLVAFSSSFPVLMTPLDWDRYYLFPVFFSTILIAVGIVQIIKSLSRWTKLGHLRNERGWQRPDALKE